jgi:hypothetical protein
MRTLGLLMLAGATVGCGGGSVTYSAAGYNLTVGDQGSFWSSGVDECAAGGTGQILLDFVDFSYLCDPTHPSQRSASASHIEMQIILTIGQPPDYNLHYPTMGPYEVGHADCKNGPTSPAIAQMLHYPPSTTTADRVVQADSGTVNITQFDATKMKPLTGRFDLKFGADEVKDSFTIYNCN